MSVGSPGGRAKEPVAEQGWRHQAQTLSNGLRVLLLPRRHLPIVSATALVRAGVFSEGPGQAGLASFTAALLSRGTRRRTAAELALDTDTLGANLGIHADYDYSMVGISSLSKQLTSALEILVEVLTEPAFSPAEVERRRRETLTLLERSKDEPTVQVRNRFAEKIYGDHPYHHPREGYLATVRSHDSAAATAFHQGHYRPNQTLLALVGDFDADLALRHIERLLSGWTALPLAPREVPGIPEARSLTVDRLQKDGVTQATLRVGSIGIRRNSPDYLPLVLLNYILGGSGFGSRLMTRLRQQLGLTYGAYSNFHPRLEPGYFFASCQTGLATMNQALSSLMAEIRRMRDEGVTEPEAEWARKFFTGSLPLTLETNDQLAARILEQEFYGLPEEFWLKDLERMRNTTRDEINDAARRYLHPERFTVVCLADFRKATLEFPLA